MRLFSMSVVAVVVVVVVDTVIDHKGVSLIFSDVCCCCCRGCRDRRHQKLFNFIQFDAIQMASMCIWIERGKKERNEESSLVVFIYIIFFSLPVFGPFPKKKDTESRTNGLGRTYYFSAQRNVVILCPSIFSFFLVFLSPIPTIYLFACKIKEKNEIENKKKTPKKIEANEQQ